jgi:catechol 2,3-dioxygenase-like lactoylglutathione lyase family enzyme
MTGGTVMLRPRALDHVALQVTDLDRTLRFYQALGLELLRTSGPDAEGIRSAVVRVGGQELNIFSRADFVPVDRDHPVGMHHFCLDMEAASVAELSADLERAGLQVFRGPVERRDGTSVFVHDPDGFKVELRVARARA